MSVNPVCISLPTMRRLIALLVLALSLALASQPAVAVLAPDCPMAASHQMPGEHQDMDCCAPGCAPECAVACPNAVMPAVSRASARDVHSQTVAVWVTKALPSADLTGADPPPRTTFS